MDSYDFIISVLALNSIYSRRMEQSGICLDQFLNDILRIYPHPALKHAKIRPHYIYGDSELLYGAIRELVQNRVLKLWIPVSLLTWDYPQTPGSYFKERIKPALADQELSDLELFAASL